MSSSSSGSNKLQAHHSYAEDAQAAVNPVDRPASGTEVELKLSCDSSTARAVAASSLLRRHRRGEAKPVHLDAVYYDTDDRDLLAAGAVLRVRTDGRRFVMTAKSRHEESGTALERQEGKVDVPTPEPERSLLPQILSRRALSAIDGRPLSPVFRTEIEREVHLLDWSGAVVELAIDQGTILAGERTEAVCEVELELVEGTSRALFELAEALVREFPLRPNIRSKSARGFALATGTPPPVTKAPEHDFKKDDTLDEVLNQVLRAAVEHLLENQPAAENGSNPEGLHQYRIALRRVRSIFALMRPLTGSADLERLQTDARWLMSGLNDTRDWDVFASETLPAVSSACGDLGGFDVLAKAAADMRRKTRRNACEAILDARNARWQIALGLWIERGGWRDGPTKHGQKLLMAPAAGFAAETLRKLHRKAVKRGRHLEELSAEDKHRLRIAVKKLRYTAQIFLPLLQRNKRYRRYVKFLAAAQEQLGQINDASVTLGLVRALTDAKMALAGQRAAGAVVGWQICRSAQADASFQEGWREFVELDPPVSQPGG